MILTLYVMQLLHFFLPLPLPIYHTTTEATCIRPTEQEESSNFLIHIRFYDDDWQLT